MLSKTITHYAHSDKDPVYRLCHIDVVHNDNRVHMRMLNMGGIRRFYTSNNNTLMFCNDLTYKLLPIGDLLSQEEIDKFGELIHLDSHLPDEMFTELIKDRL